MEGSLTHAETALLGLLAEKPKHPYQIEKDVEYREMRTWTDLSMSSIYKLLRKLEKREYLLANSELTDANRARKVYELTKEGKKALQNAVKNIISQPVLEKSAFLTGIYNSGILRKNEMLACLKKYRKALERQEKGYGDLETFLKEGGCPLQHQAVATRAIFITQAEIRWIDFFIKQLGS